MKVLLDECLPRRLKHDLPDHNVATVPEMGWAGIKNSALIRLAETSFDIFVTTDQNLPYQQNLSSAKLAVISLVAKDNRFETLHPLIPRVLAALQTVKAGDIVRVEF